MYLYFDKTGTLKEIINNEAIRQGNQNYNKVYCYFENGIDFSSGLFWKLKYPNGTESNDVSFLGTQYEENGQVPYNKDVDYKYFKDFVTYKFHVFNLTTYISQDGLYKLTITAYPTQSTANVLGTVTFNAESSVIESDPQLTQSQYSYLLGLIGEWASSINSKVDKQTSNGKGIITNNNDGTKIQRTETTSSDTYVSRTDYLGGDISSLAQKNEDELSRILQYFNSIVFSIQNTSQNKEFLVAIDGNYFSIIDTTYSNENPIFKVDNTGTYFKGSKLLVNVDTANIVDKAVTKAKLSQELQDFLDELIVSIPDGSVTTPKIVDKAVTKAKLSQALQDVIDALGYESDQFNINSADIVLTDRDESLGSALNGIDDEIIEIKELIPSDATISNQLTTESQVNDKINSVSAYYITSNVQGDAFATLQALTGASVYYSGGEVRIPTRNDYAIVLSDSTHSNATTRYSYQNGWQYQYTVNETALTQAQLDALNSGITGTKVGNYDSHLSNTNNPHNVTKSQVGLGNVVNKGMDNVPTENSDNYVKSSGVYSYTRSMVNALALSGTSGTLSASELSALNRGYGVDYVILGGTTILIKSGLQESQYVYFRFSSLTSGAENDNIGSLYNLELKINLSNGAWELVKNNQNQALYYNRVKIDALLAGKQPLLESGTNIKTVNGTSLLGSGDIAITSLDLGARYLLGAFDSADGKTRQTGVVDLGKLSWEYTSVDGQPCFQSNLYGTTSSTATSVADIVCSKYTTTTWVNNRTVSEYDQSVACYSSMLSIRDSNYTDVASFKASLQGVILQYKLATSYTDTPIEKQSILPLDTNMANKIRQKVVDGLNLFNKDVYSYVSHGTITLTDTGFTLVGTGTYANVSYSIYLKAGTYTLSLTCDNLIILNIRYDNTDHNFANLSGYDYAHFTITTDQEVRILFYATTTGSSNTINISNIMLNEGNHPYPYSDFNQKEHITNPQAELLKGEEEKSSNLYNKDAVSGVGFFTWNNGNYNSSSAYRYFNIPLDSSKGKITFNLSTIGYSVCFFNDSTYISGFYADNTTLFTRDIPSNATKLVLSLDANYLSGNMLNYGDTPEPYHEYCGEILHEVDRPKLYRHFVKLYFGDSDYSYVGEILHEKSTALTYDDLKALYPSEYKQLQLYPADPNIEDAVGNTPSYSSNHGAKITSAYFYYNSSSATPNQVFTCVMYIGPTNKLVAEERVYYENYGTTDFKVVISDSVEEI